MIEIVKKAAIEAGDFLKNNFGTLTKDQISAKGDRNFATVMDKKAEEMIVKRLKKEFPDFGVLGEENNRFKLDADDLWVIDPLDGTHNYMRGINIYGVSIGLWQKNEFTLGVVYMPEEHELYWAQKGKGAYKNKDRIHVSKVSRLKECCLSFDSSIRYRPDTMLKVLGALSVKVFNVRMFGSSARILTYVAEGVLDCSVEFYDQPWDFAGSVSLIREAGGIITPLEGMKEIDPKTVGYVASNPKLYQKIRGIVDAYL